MNRKLNILFILVDQQRLDCIGYSGKYPVKTPNIDRLASEGMWFRNAYTPIPICCPARQALLNGRRPEVFGALWNYNMSLPIAALEPGEYSWPRDLKAAGYSNGYLGTWDVNPKYNPTSYGFDDYIAEEEYRQFRREHYPEARIANDHFGETDPIPLEHTHTHWLADKAIDLIRKYNDNDKQWHVRLDFREPHLPCRPAGKFASMYRPEDIPQWEGFNETFENKPFIQKQQIFNWNLENHSWADWAPIVARYYGIISQVDDAIGKVLNALTELGLSENTMVIYTTDHGDLCGSHRMMDKHYVMYDDIVRVPMIVKWPGRVEAGSECSSFVYNCLDLAPTILEALGMEPQTFFQGRSLMPLLRGETPEDWREYVMCTYNGQQFGLYTQRMLYDGELKYVWNTTDIDELYDLNADPGELRNLIRDPKYAEKVKELRKKLCYELIAVDDGLVRRKFLRDQLLNNRKHSG